MAINQTKQNVIFDHDGGVDDLLSLMLLLTMEHVELLGVTITPADCYLSDATTSTLKILKMFNRQDIPVAQGNLHGVNPFPADWRAQPKICNGLPMMLNLEEDRTHISPLPAHSFIAELLEQHANVSVLMTGPCTNLVAALRDKPSAKASVHEVIWMGGAVDVAGNVAMHNHNTSAEWNAYWDPQATAELFASSLTIKLISLDATNALPVNIDFLKQLAAQHHYPLSDLACQFWATTINSIPSYEFTYYMWDVLATSYLGVDASAITFESRELAVSVEEPNEGQTYGQQGSGQWIDVAIAVERETVLNYVLKQFSR